jgi:crotonobetaine/carnitine-CoA ligase
MWTLGTILRHQAKEHGNRPFLSWTDKGVPVTYFEANNWVNQIANGFTQHGLHVGDHVALFLPNSLEYVISYLALAKLGAVEVAIGEASKGAFLEHQIKLGHPKILVTTPHLAERLLHSQQALATVELIVLLETDGNLANEIAGIACVPFEALHSENVAEPVHRVSPGDIAAVLFTSGTTGPSKGALLTHSQLCFFADEVVQLTALRHDDVHMTGFPLSHGNAQILTVDCSLIAGAHVVLYDRFSASDYMGRVQRSKATVINLLGATTAFVCSQPPSDQDRGHRIRCVYAAPLSPDLKDTFSSRFGVTNFVNAFGQTEISLPFMTPPGEPIPPSGCGKVVDQWFEVRLVDPETDEEVPIGTVGELLVRPKAPGLICNGYLGMPEKTVEAWRDLWFHTGDALRRDNDGWFYFVDRVKDSLRRRGENISSYEVETVVRSHQAVAECAVIAVKADEDSGEDEVKACVVLNAHQTLVYESLIAWCDEQMPSFMVPRYIEILDELPQTPSGKVQKKLLRDRGMTSGTWDRVKAGYRLSHEKVRQSG